MTGRQDPHVQYQLNAIHKKVPGIVPISDNLWNYYPSAILESINWLPFTPLFSWFNKRNNRKFADSIMEAVREMNFKDIILFNDNDIFRGFYLKEMLRPSSYVYYSRDYLLGVPYWKKHGLRLEPQHIAKADAAVANSLYLKEILQQYNPSSYYVGQGCDLRLFNAADKHPVPDDVPTGKGPIIGYVGALKSLRLDISVLVKIASERPGWQLVLVGPEDDDFKASELHHLPNVYFTGHKDLSQLPSYVQSFDVCLNPQVINEVTAGNYPLKIDEYLAMGKPVVATATKTMELFREHVYLAATPDDYVPLIEKALSENADPGLATERIRFAGTHTWENSVAAIYQAILNSSGN